MFVPDLEPCLFLERDVFVRMDLLDRLATFVFSTHCTHTVDLLGMVDAFMVLSSNQIVSASRAGKVTTVIDLNVSMENMVVRQEPSIVAQALTRDCRSLCVTADRDFMASRVTAQHHHQLLRLKQNLHVQQ